MPTIPFPIPTGLPIDLCTPTPSGTLACVQTGGIINNFGAPRDCQYGSTPPLVSVNVTYQEETISFFGDSEIRVKNSVWLGVETDLDAVWVGEEKSKSCARFSLPNIDPSASINTVIDKAWDTSRDVVRWFGMNPDSALGSIIVIFVVIIIALLIDGVPFPY